MALYRLSKLEAIEDHHPGLCRQLEAMFQALIPVRVIAAAIKAQYGERIGPRSLRAYRTECRELWQEAGGSDHLRIGSLSH